MFAVSDLTDSPIATINARIREIVSLTETAPEINKPFHGRVRYLDYDDDLLHVALLRCHEKVPATTARARKEQLRYEARVDYPKSMTLFEMLKHIPGSYEDIDAFNSPGNGITYITDCYETEGMMTILRHIASIYPDRYRKRFYHIRKPGTTPGSGVYHRTNVLAVVISE